MLDMIKYAIDSETEFKLLDKDNNINKYIFKDSILYEVDKDKNLSKSSLSINNLLESTWFDKTSICKISKLMFEYLSNIPKNIQFIWFNGDLINEKNQKSLLDILLKQFDKEEVKYFEKWLIDNFDDGWYVDILFEIKNKTIQEKS